MRKLDSERLKRNEQSLEIVNLNLLSLQKRRKCGRRGADGYLQVHIRTYRGSIPVQHPSAQWHTQPHLKLHKSRTVHSNAKFFTLAAVVGKKSERAS